MPKDNKKIKIGLFTCIVFDVLIIVGLLFLYGPIDFFRDTWITTAMETRSHQYLANVLFSQKTIDKVMSRNYVVVNDEATDTKKIKNEESKEILAINEEYEKEILTRNKGNSLYKIIDIKEGKYKGWLVVVYKPKNLQIITADKLGKIGQRLTDMSREHNALVGINAGGFLDDGVAGRPSSYVIVDNKIVYNGSYGNSNGGMVGINNDGVLVLANVSAEKALEMNIKYAVQFSPYLIVNGKPTSIYGNGGGGVQPRTAIGQRKDGIMLFLVIDGRRPGYSIGATYTDLIKLMQRYGAYNAANLDGGSTTTMTVNGKLYNRPTSSSKTGEKKIPNAFILK